MNFTYEWYAGFIKNLKNQGYNFADYHSWKRDHKTVILRHDVDFNLAAAAELAEIESKIFEGGGYKR